MVFASVVPAARLADHLRAVRAVAGPGYRVTPEGARDRYVPVVWATMRAGAPRSLLGVDLASDPVRRSAMELVPFGRTSRATLPVTLLQPAGLEPRRGVDLIRPVLAHIHGESSDGSALLPARGYVAAQIDVAELLGSVLAASGARVQAVVYDGIERRADTLLHAQDESVEEAHGAVRVGRTLQFQDRTWTLELAFADRTNVTVPLSIGMAGVLCAVFAFARARSRPWVSPD